MPEEQESEELLSDVQDPAVEGSLEAAQLQLPGRPDDVTTTPSETSTMSKLEGIKKKYGFSPSSIIPFAIFG